MFGKYANSKNSDQTHTNAQTDIGHRFILKYRMIQKTDSEGPNQTAHMRSLIRAYAVCICRRNIFTLRGPFLLSAFDSVNTDGRETLMVPTSDLTSSQSDDLDIDLGEIDLSQLEKSCSHGKCCIQAKWFKGNKLNNYSERLILM